MTQAVKQNCVVCNYVSNVKRFMVLFLGTTLLWIYICSILWIKTKRMTAATRNYPLIVKIWLSIGVFMLFMQVVIGGITRLTGSGLSITKWEIVTGAIPPLNAQQWNEAFDLYKATPQYQKINEGMSLGDFKFIYFWEYFHRLWARTMGFVFLIPFLIFWRLHWIDKPLMRRLGIVVLLAALAAAFGWIMVASGLENRPWVNAYKLTLHLSIALSVFGYLWWVTIGAWQPERTVAGQPRLKRGALLIGILIGLQIMLGGVVSGMKAALVFPTWPDMNGAFLPAVLLDGSQWSAYSFTHYDASAFMPALVQFLHRNTAYLIAIAIAVFAVVGWKRVTNKTFRLGIAVLVTLLITQITLGIFTLINSTGFVPVGLGVLHQATALLLLAAILYVNYQFKKALN